MLPPQEKINVLGCMGNLVWKRNQPPYTSYEILCQRHKHNVIHQKRRGTSNQFRKVIYGRLVFDAREVKSKKNRTILAVGGNRIKHLGDCGTSTADLLTDKFLLNSAISNLGTKSTTLDINSKNLNTPLAEYKYIRLKLFFSRECHKII